MAHAEIGIFGGSGFTSLLDSSDEIEIDTPFGPPSAPLVTGEIAGRAVAFLPRHGRKHEFPPHKINYRANLWAMKEIGVTRVLAPSAAGSLQPNVKPGSFVVSDQLVDRTSGRIATFYDGPATTHVSLADPYCPQLRHEAAAKARALGIDVHEQGTVVVIEGPRFATRAESRWYSQAGWHVINMTQYPEAVLAREVALCYCNISLITDYDVGLEGMPPVSVPEVLKVFRENNERLRSLLFEIVPAIPAARECPCGAALDGAVVGGH
ncbi:MAG: S-methyl-5'-thioadenosine phosphorylase [Actinomycetota bacterium]|nr:S-methyl-5'-thioadenosine phosphorylase [Actinomycetota bacterium]